MAAGAAVTLLFIMGTQQSFAFEDVRIPLTLGVQTDGLAVRGELLNQTKAGLSEALPQFVLEYRYFPAESLKATTLSGEIDFLLSSASVAAAMQHYAGFSPIASATPLSAYAPEHSEAAVLLVRSKDSQVKTLGDLNSAKIAIPDTESADVRIQISEEMRLRGIVRNEHFSFRRIPAESISELLSRFGQGELKADAVGISALYDLNPEDLRRNGIRVLEPRLNDDLSAAHTTSTYPGWVLSASYRVSADAVRQMAAVLKSLPEAGGWRWTEPADMRSMHPMLMRSDPFYAEFKPKRLEDYLAEYRQVLWILGVLALAVVFHVLRTGYLLRRRTRELTRANELRLETERRYHLLEKQNIVGQISSIVAHEIRQPLAAVSNYAMALRRRHTNGSLDGEALSYGLDRLVAESARANEIVNYVQKFVRTAKKDKSWVNVTLWIKQEAQGYSDSAGNARVIAKAADDVRYLIDKNDLQLMVRNLLKNALEATADPTRHPVELFCAKSEEGGLSIRVSDSGPALSDEAFKNLSMPLNSTKIGGLGLGVSIVRLLAESYGGHLEFSRRQPSGLLAAVVLPPCAPAEEN